MSGAKTCRQCGSEVALTRLEHVQGEKTGVRVEFEGMPAYSCARGHRRFLTPDFPMRLIERLLKADGALAAPHAVKKGLIRKHYHCPGCGGELGAEPGTHASARHNVALSESAPFDVGLTVALFRCGACGRDCLHPADEVRTALMEAAADAFRAANVPPG